MILTTWQYNGNDTKARHFNYNSILHFTKDYILNLVDGLMNNLQKALDNQDGFSISIIVTRLENLGYVVKLDNDTKKVIVTKEQ